jgi:hypothetical protein
MAYELHFSFSTPEEMDQFLDLVRSNEDFAEDYIQNDFMSATTEERFGMLDRSQRSYPNM